MPLQWNLAMAWLWIFLGFASGAALGMGFHREAWLGGYTSHKRRLYRLGHISFFGLALVNLMFYFTARSFAGTSLAAAISSWGFIIGAATMPVCCLITAHKPQARPLFAVPVLSLLGAGALTFLKILNP
jgi:predicted MFS family arabinose efflux permease